MDPRSITAEQWDQIGFALTSLIVSTGLGVGGALALLLGRAVAPSIVPEDAPGPARAIQWALAPLGVLALVGAAVALVVSLFLAVQVIAALYPRFWL